MPVLKADTYVLIVGAGPVGVTLQLLLSRMGVPCLLAERNIHPRSHPRSHYVSNRSTEVWRQLGHLDKVVECITEPLKFWASMRYCRHIADPHLNLFGTVNHFRGHYTYGDTYHEELSPARITNIAQHKLLLLLKAASLTRSPVYPNTSDERYIAWLRDHYDQVMRTSTFDDAKRAKLSALRGPTIFPDGFDSVKRTLDQRCGVPFVDGGLKFERFINEDMSKGVISELTCQRRNVKVHVNSAFVVGADGVHSRVRRFIDRRNPDRKSQVQDTSLLRDVMSVYFTSDELGKLVKDSPAMLYFIFSRCVSVLTCQGGSPAEFVVQIPFFSEVEDSSGYDVAKCTACINEFVGTTLSDLRVVSIKRWRATTEIAPSFVDPGSYRVMVAGDSAHIVTPAGGQGMNMGVADTYNLAWRIGRSFYQRLLRGGPGTSAADVINAELTPEEKCSMADYSRERLAVAEHSRDVCLAEVIHGSAFARSIRYNHGIVHRVLDWMPPLGPLTSRTLYSGMQFVTTAMKHLYSTPKMMDTIRRGPGAALSDGDSLGLTIPGADLGYAYTDGPELKLSASYRTYEPTAVKGLRLPHCFVYSTLDNQVYRLSTVDLPSFMQPAVFHTFIVFSDQMAREIYKALCDASTELRNLWYVCLWSTEYTVDAGDINDQPLILEAPDITRMGMDIASELLGQRVQRFKAPKMRYTNFVFQGIDSGLPGAGDVIKSMGSLIQSYPKVPLKGIFSSRSTLEKFSKLINGTESDMSRSLIVLRPDGHIKDYVPSAELPYLKDYIEQLII